MTRQNGDATAETVATPAISPVVPSDRLEADMALAHERLIASAAIRSNMSGHLSRAMESKLNASVAEAAAHYANAYKAFEAAS